MRVCLYLYPSYFRCSLKLRKSSVFFHWPLLNRFNKWTLSFCCLTKGPCCGWVWVCGQVSRVFCTVLSQGNAVKMHIRKEMLDPSLKLESAFVVAGWGKERVGENTH